ncbi:MAG: type 11 methyltransferase [Parcubacteria group bacterium GW2011_GWC1_38_6]|nr:MAG: type 11 methyltransferase [Parcubacteria group bacterium GW2011_GWA1_36_12]KKQ76691.1 MAG: type 11 methyltransferase [Parcubacteria group bacterium GW2011_GWC1_38_6]
MLGFRRIYERKLKQYLESIHFQGGDVLDVGCGQGQYSDIFKNNNYLGIDIDTKAINYARKKYNNSRFEIMDMTKIDLLDSSFDFVFSVAVLHHLEDGDLLVALKEILRVTKNKGHIWIVDIVLPPSLNFLAYPFFYIDKGAKIRSFQKLSQMLSGTFKIKSSRLERFYVFGIALFEIEKI